MVSDHSLTTVLVTGGSGFVGAHVVLHLLQLGYRVRTSVRSDASGKAMRQTLSSHVDATGLEITCADLLADAGWDEAVQGCEYVIHTACPYPFENPKDENEVIVPARDGTLRVLRAAQAAGVRRMILLSSIGAIFDGHEGESRTFREADWADLEHARLLYHKAKALAEQAAWDFVRGSGNPSGMELVAINPTNVFGPVLDGHLHTSTEWYRTLMRGEGPGVPVLQLDFVDVRDVVDVLARAMAEPGAAGKRFLCNAVSIPVAEFANILHQEFSKRGYRVPTRVLPGWIFPLFAVFNTKVKAIVSTIGWKYTLSTEQLQSVFGWQPRPYKQTILDMAESLIEYGVV